MTTIGGRLTPDREPCPHPRIVPTGLASGEVRAECTEGDFASVFPAGHPVEDYVRLEAMHGGSGG